MAPESTQFCPHCREAFAASAAKDFETGSGSSEAIPLTAVLSSADSIGFSEENVREQGLQRASLPSGLSAVDW